MHRIAQKEAAVGDNVRYKVLPLRYENGSLSFLNSGSGRYYVIEEAQCIGIHRVSSLLVKKTGSALGIAYEETAFSLEELFDADEVIVTSSSNLCLRADQIDGIKVGNKDYDTYERLREYLLNEFYLATT